MRKVGWAASAALLVGMPAYAAESLYSYATTCATQLGLSQVPGYTCTQGSSASGAGFLLWTPNNKVGRVKTENPNVDAVFLCRDYDSGTNKAALNGYILQNQVTGNTCFFDAIEGGTATVPSPNAGNAASYWDPPSKINGKCSSCHSSDPFIASPGLAQGLKDQGMIRKGRNLKGAYNIVNSGSSTSHFYKWNEDRNINTAGCFSTCHQSSTNGDPASWATKAVSEKWMPTLQGGFQPPSVPRSSIGVWRPGAKAYFYLDANNNYMWDAADKTGQFGKTGDKPYVLKGTDCGTRNVAHLGVLRAGVWKLTTNNHYFDAADTANEFSFGTGMPVSWNGQIVDFEGGAFTVDYNGNNHLDYVPGGEVSFYFGNTTDTPLVGRWKFGTGHRMAVFRNVGGLGYFYIDTNGNNYWDAGDTGFQFGSGTDVPFSGDFNGDGLDEVGVFRNGAWYIDLNNNFVYDGPNGGGDYIISFGQAGDTPIVSPTKWNCGW